MKKIRIFFIFLLLSAAGVQAQHTGGIGRGDFKLTYAYPVIVSNAHAGSNGGYTSLKLAFDAINAQNQTGFNITVNIDNNSTETASAVLNAGLWTTLSIYPTATGLTISGNLAAPLIDLNGADNVTIDGRVNATGSANDLTITNTSTSTTSGTSTIRFINDASRNKVKYCTLKGSSTTSTGGILFFSTTTGTTGNNGNTIDNNNLTCAADANRIYSAIYSYGQSVTIENSGDTIRNNNFYNYCNRNGSSLGINLFANTTNWTITANSFYETASFVSTASSNYYFIYIIAGNHYSITSNYIGGSGPVGSGTWTKTGNFSNWLYGIFLNTTSGTASEIQGNVIRNFSWTGTSGWFYGIRAEGAGSVNIGTSAGNTIGAGSGNDSFVWTATSNYDNIYGFYFSNTGTIVSENNIVGAFSANNATANATCIYGIYKTGSGTTTISANTIGSTSTSSSIQSISASTASAQTIYGIYSSGSGSVSISNNTVSKLTNGSTNTSITDYGLINGITTTSGINTISDNTVRDLTIGNANYSTDYRATVTGICQTSTTAGQTVSGNIIYNLSNTFTTP